MPKNELQIHAVAQPGSARYVCNLRDVLNAAVHVATDAPPDASIISTDFGRDVSDLLAHLVQDPDRVVVIWIIWFPNELDALASATPDNDLLSVRAVGIGMGDTRNFRIEDLPFAFRLWWLGFWNLYRRSPLLQQVLHVEMYPHRPVRELIGVFDHGRERKATIYR